MKDRVSTEVLENGAIRYGIYDAAGTLLRYEYIKPEDVPTEAGDVLNKANILPDATCDLLGLAHTAVLKDALNAIPSLIISGSKYVKLLETTVGTAAAAVTLSFSGIDMTQYNLIEIRTSLLHSISNKFIAVTINNITSNYYYGSTTGQSYFVNIKSGSTRKSQSIIKIAYDPDNTNEQDILAHTISGYYCDDTPSMSLSLNSTSGVLATLTAGITSIKFTAASGNIAIGSKFTVYGVKK